MPRIYPRARFVLAPPCRPSRLVAGSLALLQGACGGGPSDGDERGLRADDPAASRDSVVVDGKRYPLSAAIGEIWGRTGPYPTHFNVDFTLANGRFVVVPIVVDGQNASVREPRETSAVLRAELYASDAVAFTFADYAYVADPEAPGAIDGRHFFTGARLGVDEDGDGDVEPVEMRDIIGGTIDFEGPLPDISLSFTLVLEDGANADGGYGGFFEFIPLD